MWGHEAMEQRGEEEKRLDFMVSGHPNKGMEELKHVGAFGGRQNCFIIPLEYNE